MFHRWVYRSILHNRKDAADGSEVAYCKNAICMLLVLTQFHVAGENLNGDKIYSSIFNRAWGLGWDYVANVSTLDAWRNRTWHIMKSLIATAWLFSCWQDQCCAYCNSPWTTLSVQCSMMDLVPFTVASRFKTRNIFILSDAEIVVSNPSRSTDVCLSLFCVCGVLCR
jgi:hypothetical protein